MGRFCTRRNYIDAEDCYFWATHQRAELDLLIGKKLVLSINIKMRLE